MLAARRDGSREAWWVRGVVVAVVLLVLAAGLCLLDGDDHDTAGQLVPDLCLSVLAVSLTVMPFAGLLAVGWTRNAPDVAAYVVARHIPDPPPRPALFR
jgi:hypothetical protein